MSSADRQIEITLERRAVSCVARLLNDRAPRTCAAIWDALPQGMWAALRELQVASPGRPVLLFSVSASAA